MLSIHSISYKHVVTVKSDHEIMIVYCNKYVLYRMFIKRVSLANTVQRLFNTDKSVTLLTVRNLVILIMFSLNINKFLLIFIPCIS